MSLGKRVLTVSGWTFVSRVLGLVRDRLFAGTFGASPLLDAFMMAFQLPNLLRNLFGEGALSAAFVPRYVQARDRDPAAAEAFAGQVLTRLALGLSILCALAMVVAAALAAWFGFDQAAVMKASAAHLPFSGSTRVAVVAYLSLPQLPFLVLICVSAIMGGILNGRRRFWVPAAAPVVLNLCLIATMWMRPEDEIWALPYAVLAAGVSQVVLHALALKASGGVPPIRMDAGPEIVDLRRAFMPVLIATSIYQVNAFLDSLIAYAFLGAKAEGAVAILYFGNRLLQFPMALIAHGIGTAAYPELSSRAADGGWSATGDGLRAASRLLAFFLLPAAVGLLVVSEPLVRAIYQTGSFGRGDEIERTILVTRFLALALVPISLSKLQVRAFHVHRDQRTPMRLSLAMVAINLAMNLVLVQTALREAGLALSTAIASAIGCVAYAVLLRRRGAGAALEWRPLARPLIASLAMAVAVWALLRGWPQPPGRGSRIAVLRLGAAVALGAMVYLPIAGLGWLRRRRGGGGGAAGGGESAPVD